MTALILVWSAVSNTGPVFCEQAVESTETSTRTAADIVRMGTPSRRWSGTRFRLSRRQRVVHHLAVHDRQHRAQRPDLVVGHPHRIEVVVAQDHQIAEL